MSSSSAMGKRLTTVEPRAASGVTFFGAQPDSPTSAARKVLAADRGGSVYIANTMDEDDDQALYTEVVVSDDEFGDNLLEPDDDDDDDSFLGGQVDVEKDDFLLRKASLSPAPSPPQNSTPVSLLFSSNDNIKESGNAGPLAVAGSGYEPDEEKDFRIRHLLNYGPAGALGSIASDGSYLVPPSLMAAPTDSPFVTPSSPSRRFKSRSDQHFAYDAALLVDDKPWRTHGNLPPPGPGFRNKNFTPQPNSTPGGRSFLGRFKRSKNKTASKEGDVEDEDGDSCSENFDKAILGTPQRRITNDGPKSTAKEHIRRKSHPTAAVETEDPKPTTAEGDGSDADHDLVVEASSLPSSDGSSFGDGDDSSFQRDAGWEEFQGDGNGFTDQGCFEWEKPVDWNMLADFPLPTHFGHTAVGLYSRRASSSSASVVSENGAILSQQRASHFVWQQGMLLHALLQLLVERECLGVEGSMDAEDNIWKKGPLKKLARENKGRSKKWKIKYVEVRRGNLCYYEDHGLESGRESIHLRSSDTQVSQVTWPYTSAVLGTPMSSTAPQFIFEIQQIGSPTRLWMAQSEEDLQAWIRAIQAAMIGDDDDVDNGVGDDERRTSLEDLAPHHQLAVARYTGLQLQLKKFDVHEDYVAAVRTLGRTNQGNGSGELDSSVVTLQIPVSWIRQQIKDLGGDQKTNKNKKVVDRFKPCLHSATFSNISSHGNTDPHKQIRASITEFWNNMKETAFAINGLVIPREMPFSTERVFGSLTRCIMQYDNAVVQVTDTDGCNPSGEAVNDPVASGNLISELQAVSYARDILVTVLRTREQQDVLYAVNELLRNDDLVVLSTKEEDDICHLEVSFAGEDWQDITRSEAVGECDMTIWLNTKRKNSPGSSWRKRFAVLSGVVLSYYQSASPRPHGLRGQLVLNQSSTVATLEEINKGEKRPREVGEPNVLVVSTKDEVRYFSFDSNQDMLEWKEAIQNAICSCDDAGPGRDLNSSRSKNAEANPKQSKFRVPGSRAVKGRINAFRRRRLQHRLSSGGSVGGGGGGDDAKLSSTSTTAIIPQRPSMELLMDKSAADLLTAAGNPASLSNNHHNNNAYNNANIIKQQREPTVQCVVQHLHRFVIRDRFIAAGSNNECEGVLFRVHAKLFQAFTLSGGPNGRLARGNSLIEIEIVESVSEDEDGQVN